MSSPDLLHVTVEQVEDACLVRAIGEVELSSAGALRRELDAARAEGMTVLLDLSGVTFMDSTGLRVLLEASQSSVLSDWAFFVVRPSKATQRLIQLSGTADMLTLADTSAERTLA